MSRVHYNIIGNEFDKMPIADKDKEAQYWLIPIADLIISATLVYYVCIRNKQEEAVLTVLFVARPLLFDCQVVAERPRFAAVLPARF